MATLARYLEPMPYTDHFGEDAQGTVATASGAYTFGRPYYWLVPGEVKGIRFWNPLSARTFRFGVFRNTSGSMVELTDQRIDVACDAGYNDVMFAETLVIDWEHIAKQRDSSSGTWCDYLAIQDQSGSPYWVEGYKSHTNAQFMHPFNENQYGIMVQSGKREGLRSASETWEAPTAGSWYIPMDPICIPYTTGDDYDYTPEVYWHGENYAGIELINSVSGQQGVGFYPRMGDLLYGARFYTHDTAPWTAEVRSFYPSDQWGGHARMDAAAGTVSCTGRGVYDVLFPTPVTITETHIRFMGDGRMCWVAINNQTNQYWTRGYSSGIGIPIDPDNGIHFPRRFQQFSARAYSSNLNQAPTFGRTNEVYPVDPLIKAA